MLQSAVCSLRSLVLTKIMIYIPEKIDIQRLIEFSGEHLYYEIDMLYGVTKLLQEGQKNSYVFNAFLESFVVHASNILDFFYRPQIKSDDARAIHYMDDPKKWQEQLPPYEKHFEKFDHKRNKRVMHLSYKRLDIPSDQRKWESPKITKEIQKLVDLFLDKANPRYLHPRLYQLRGNPTV